MNTTHKWNSFLWAIQLLPCDKKITVFNFPYEIKIAFIWYLIELRYLVWRPPWKQITQKQPTENWRTNSLSYLWSIQFWCKYSRPLSVWRVYVLMCAGVRMMEVSLMMTSRSVSMKSITIATFEPVPKTSRIPITFSWLNSWKKSGKWLHMERMWHSGLKTTKSTMTIFSTKIDVKLMQRT